MNSTAYLGNGLDLHRLCGVYAPQVNGALFSEGTQLRWAMRRKKFLRKAALVRRQPNGPGRGAILVTVPFISCPRYYQRDYPQNGSAL